MASILTCYNQGHIIFCADDSWVYVHIKQDSKFVLSPINLYLWPKNMNDSISFQLNCDKTEIVLTGTLYQL